ncbi:MAG: phage major capsid protein [Planctomycetes bacterium]|nr:phage major capsid protein [Planctomycetota bacterium]
MKDESGGGNVLADLATKFQTNATAIKTAQEAADKEIKAVGAVAEETKTALAAAQKAQTELKALFEAMDKKLIDMEVETKRLRESAAPVQLKTMGRLFVESEIFTGLKAAGRGDNMPFEMQRKDITSLSTSAGPLIRPDRDPEVYRNPNRPTRIKDLIPSIPTASGSVEVMRQLVFTNAAAPQGTVAGQGGGEFVAKAQSNITWSLETYTVKTIAHWLPASRQALKDAPMLQGLIDTDLTYGLELENDEQLLFGDGTGQNVTGIMVDTDVPTVGEIAVGTAVGDRAAAMIDHIRSAITNCQTNEYYNMTGVVLNPVDWETLETAKATDGHYLMIQFPSQGAEEVIWRVPVVVTNAMTVDNFVVGDWTMGAKVYENEDVTIRVSESHADYFVKNGVAILAEERYAMAVTRPFAFTKGLFTIATV